MMADDGHWEVQECGAQGRSGGRGRPCPQPVRHRLHHGSMQVEGPSQGGGGLWLTGMQRPVVTTADDLPLGSSG
jgi:hypothetical protein